MKNYLFGHYSLKSLDRFVCGLKTQSFRMYILFVVMHMQCARKRAYLKN